jgi:phosphohistidine phosphatase
MQRSLRGARLHVVDDVGPQRRLIVMRHAKAEPFADTDQARRLTDRGLADAGDAGRHLAAAGLRPDFALVSSATRTRQTWEQVAAAAGLHDTEVSLDDALFSGSADVVLDAVRQAPDDALTVMFVGHNPTAAFLSHLLDDGEGDPEATSALLSGFPPAAVTILEITVPWADLGAECGRVVGFYVGRS